jgi:hypothetical protein
MISQEKKMQEKLSSKEFSKYILRREIHESKEFMISNEDFGNLYSACQFLIDNEYSYGSMSRQLPIPIQLGSDYKLHQKWYNLSEGEKKNVDGVILSDDFRNGTVKILIFNKQKS